MRRYIDMSDLNAREDQMWLAGLGGGSLGGNSLGATPSYEEAAAAGLGRVGYEQAAASGLGLRGLGAIPYSCPTGASAEFDACRAQAISKAKADCAPQAKSYCTQMAQGAPLDQAGDIYASCYDSMFGDCLNAQSGYYFNAYDCFGKCPGATPPCTSKEIVGSVQEDLGRPVTGVWTVEDQKALDAKGTTFLAYAPSCTGAAPVAKTTTQVAPAPKPALTCPSGQYVKDGKCVPLPTAEPKKASMLMLGLGALAVVGLGYALTRKPKGKRRRR